MSPVQAYSVLIADDESGSREGIDEYLRRSGFRTFVADDGTGALEIARREVIHLGIFDVQMPTLGGFDVARTIRDEGKSLPVIFISADGSVEMRTRALGMGGFEFVAKPIELDLFRVAVEAALVRFYGNPGRR
jgi:two-component system OmpR family response regulator